MADERDKAPIHVAPTKLAAIDEEATSERGYRPIGVGTVIAGKFRLDELLGSGGMGQVFKAQHLLLHVPVAVKVLHPYIAVMPGNERRFQREARAATVLNHPNVVRVLDYGRHADTSYIVMEHVHGVPLHDWLVGLGGLPSIEVVADITLQLLAALEAAHALNIVHRDLKPENVLVTESSNGVLAKIVDFGLAHVDDPADLGPTLTERDAIAGTPAYMSPEQCRSLAVGPSTDLYAIGCLLTTTLQGEPPFTGAAPMDLIAKQMFLPPPPLRRPEGAEPVPPLLERLRLDLLAKQPHARPKDAATAAARLREAISPEAHEKRLPPRKGETPMGNREERALRSVPPPASEAISPHAESLAVDVVTLASDPEDWRMSHAAGLAALGISVSSVREKLEPREGSASVMIVDVGGNLDAAVEALGSMGDVSVIVCIDHLDAAGMNRLIEGGAADVLRYPISVDRLAKRIRRTARRSALR